jgi:hypothetical protein
VAVLLALAELVSWWAVLVLPAALAAMVKINDLVMGPPRATRHRCDDARSGAPVDGAHRSRSGRSAERPPESLAEQPAQTRRFPTANRHTGADRFSADESFSDTAPSADTERFVGNTHSHRAGRRPVAEPRRPVDGGSSGSARHAHPTGLSFVTGPRSPADQVSGAPPAAGPDRTGEHAAPEPPGAPGANGRPARSQVLGSAVRRQMAAHLQRSTAVAAPAGGRHARRDAEAGADRRGGFNERQFRSA